MSQGKILKIGIARKNNSILHFIIYFLVLYCRNITFLFIGKNEHIDRDIAIYMYAVTTFICK